MARVAHVLPEAGYPLGGPLCWYSAMVLRRAMFEVVSSHEHVSGSPALVVAMGARCHEVATIPGMFMSPPLSDRALTATLGENRGPLLLVGSNDHDGWSQAAAARLRHAEVLQLAGVDRNLEIPGDFSASVPVLVRVMERFASMIDRTH